MLIAPDGRLLAHLQPGMGVDLSAYVNQSLGIIGPRSYRADLKADVITVRSVHPVRLRGF
jgi:hypothetical protein